MHLIRAHLKRLSLSCPAELCRLGSAKPTAVSHRLRAPAWRL